MLINTGIEIHFSADSADDNASLGITDRVATFVEGTGEITAGINYRDDLLIKDGWISGFSDNFDLRSYVRPQIIGDVTIKISNITGIYNDLASYGYDLDGRRVEIVFFTTDGTKYPAPSYYIKDVNPTGLYLTLTLADITTQQNIDVSKPIEGDKWYPLVIGDHEKGVYVGAGLKREDVDTFQWSFILINSSGVIPTYNTTNRTFTFGETFNGVPKERVGKAPSYYASTNTDMWFTVTSGGGSGSYKIASTVDDTDRVAIPFTKYPVYDIDTGAYDIKTLDAEGGVMTEDVTVGVVETLSLEYSSDTFSGITSDILADVVNSEGAVIPTNTIDKDGVSISLGDSEIDGNSIIGYSFGEMGTPAYTETLSERQTGISTISIANTGDTGVVTNTTDRDVLTSYDNDYTCDFSVYSTQSVGFTITQQYSVEGDFPDLHSIIYDMKLQFGKNAVIDRAEKTITVTAEYTWKDVSPYASISNPVTISEYTFTNGDTGTIEPDEDILMIIRNTPPYYYTGDGATQYNNKNGDDNISAVVSEDVGRFVSGSVPFETENLFAGEKKPDGVRISIVLEFDMIGDGSGIVGYPQEGSFDLSTEVYSIGVQNKPITTNIEDSVFSQISGRPYITFRLYQEHLVKLMNWSLNFKTEPTEGWGLGECSTADVSFNVTNTTPIRSQWKDSSKLTTKAQIDIVMRESWNTVTNTATGKVWSSFLDKLGAETPTNSYAAPSECTILDATVFDEQDGYNTFTIEYDYDIATNSYNKSISVEQVSKSSYDTSYVTGVTAPTDASNLWDKCNVLYGVAKSEKRLPDNLSKLRNIYEEEDAIEYILNFIALAGVNGGSTYNPNYLVKALHPVDDLFDNPSMSTIGYTGINIWNGQEATGVVIGRKYNPNPKKVEITSIVKPAIIVGRIIEDETNIDRIIELETNIDRIVEVGA